MSFWIILALLLLVLSLLGIVFLVTRFHRFAVMQRLAEKHRALSWLLSVLPVVGLAAGSYFLFNLFSMFVIMLHLVIIWLVCELTAKIVRAATKKEPRRYDAGGAALLLTAAVLGAGWYFAHHIFETDYTLQTKKDLGGKPLRIALIADSHLSTTLSGADFAEQVQRIQEKHPDLLVIAGDFVDDDTKKEDMERACEALGGLQTTCGVYYAPGNHDSGYFDYRSFDESELTDTMQQNGITVLKDTCVHPDDRFYLIGREDFYKADRLSAQTLTEGLDSSKYCIILNHEPNDYANEAESGADLVLSGHTHGGHIFPGGFVGLLLGMNDRVYGTETRGNTTFLVTSGISGWAIPFKTGAISEFCIIDIIEE